MTMTAKYESMDTLIHIAFSVSVRRPKLYFGTGTSENETCTHFGNYQQQCKHFVNEQQHAIVPVINALQ